MINAALVAMVVVGCDSDARICEFIKETPAQWATVTECEAEMKHQMLTAGTFQYPTVTGLCRAVGDGAEVVSVDDATRPIQASAAAPVPASEQAAIYDSLVEGGRSVLYRTANGYTVVRNKLGQAASGTAELARRAGGRLIARLASF